MPTGRPGQPVPAVDAATVAAIQAAPAAIAARETIDGAPPGHVGRRSTPRRWRSCSSSSPRSTARWGCSGSGGRGPWPDSWRPRSRPASIVLGASIASFLLGLLSMGTLIVATTILLGRRVGSAHRWSRRWPWPRSSRRWECRSSSARWHEREDQASGWNAMVAITLAILGGSMIPLVGRTRAPAPAQPADAARVVPAGDRHDGRRRTSSSRTSCPRSPSCSASGSSRARSAWDALADIAGGPMKVLRIGADERHPGCCATGRACSSCSPSRS